MTEKNLEISTLAAYVDSETERWRQWFATADSEVFELPLGPESDRTIRSLIKHIFAVELRYAQRLVGEPVSTYEEMADGTVKELWAIHEAAVDLRDRFLRDATSEELDRILVSDTR